MILRLVIVLLLAGGIAACGIKSRLDPPPGDEMSKDEKDPSMPPEPLGR